MIGQMKSIIRICNDNRYLIRDLQLMISEFLLKGYKHDWILKTINRLQSYIKNMLLKFFNKFKSYDNEELLNEMKKKFNYGS